MDYPKALNARNDFIAGIDNDGLDFHNLEQFMQVAASVGALDENAQHGNPGSFHLENCAEVGSDGAGLCSAKMESPHTPPLNVVDGPGGVGSGRVNGGNLAIAAPQTHVRAQLPESPPDSGSEPAYSPLGGDGHALGVTTRELYHPQLQSQQIGIMRTDLHYPPPHNFPPHVQIEQDLRVKHEGGLLLNAGTLLSQPQVQLGPQLSLENQGQLHDQLMYQPTTQQHYDNMLSGGNGNVGLYTSTSYQSLSSLIPDQTCMLTTSLGERVQVIGTSQLSLNRTSAPSTPVHSSSRKRKMSTQLDCPELGPSIKHDPGLVMSPIRASHHSLANDGSAYGTGSPLKISLPTLHSHSHSDLSKTPAHTHSSASASPALSTVNSHGDSSLDGNGSRTASANNIGSGGSEAGDTAQAQCIGFAPFQPESWHKLCDQSLQELSVIFYRVDADKGFNFSVSDDAYVCQKKNHFQVTCHARLQGDAKFVKTPSGLEKIKSFHLHFYGVKFEAPNQTIRVEQSQSDRSKKPFYPVPIDLQSHIVSKITVGRLHFSETTNNNMRKKGRPNPEQRYFQLVVGLHVHTTSGSFPVVSHGSERIIVRASNPGQFESDVDLCWQRGLTQESVFHAGRVGINTDRPDESLVVHGNLKVSGHIVQPSDSRAKQEIAELDTSVQLRNLQKIRIVRYRYEPQFAVHSGLKRASTSDSEEIVDTGVIAQEVREVIPDAVQEAGSVVLPNGNVIENFLLVNKDRILMENIGAVKELCKVTGSLETRIEHLERASNPHPMGKELDPRNLLADHWRKLNRRREGYEICSSRTLQVVIFLLIIVMAACLAAVSTLYFVEHNKQQQLEGLPMFGNGHIFRTDGTSHMSDEERHYLQHNLHALFKNKTHVAWPSLMYAASTSRPPATPNGSRQREDDDTEELAAVMGKPILNIGNKHSSITTTAPRSNKTISVKNKKWPLPQEVIRAAHVVQKHGGRVPFSTSTSQQLEELQRTNNNITSEKPDVIPVPQDFENNSIDIDSQHLNEKTLSGTKDNERGAIVARNEESEELQSDHIGLKLDEHIVVVGTIPSTSSSSSNSNSLNIATAPGVAGHSIRKLGASDAVIYNVYKTVSPPTDNLALTTNKVNTELMAAHVALDVPPLIARNSSSSSRDNGDALDLQNLSNSNNDSIGNPNQITAIFGFAYADQRDSNVGRRSANQRSLEWIKDRIINVKAFGKPPECDSKSVVSDKCQSVCFEEEETQSDALDTNSSKQTQSVDDQLQSAEELQAPSQESLALTSPVANDTLFIDTGRVHPGKSSHTTSADAKQYSSEVDASLGEEHDSISEVTHSLEQLSLLPEPTELVNQAQTDCWEISSWLSSGQVNRTINMEHYCPNAGHSLNTTYNLSISRYLQATKLDLQFNFNRPLQWSVCQENAEQLHVETLIDKDEDMPTSTSVRLVKQVKKNQLILALDIPKQGHFLRSFMLRASHDMDQQKLCDDSAHVANTILQYNFSIVRNCD